MKSTFMIELETTTQIQDHKIKQKVVLLDAKMVGGETVVSRVCGTMERQLRDALIKLGWTPPKSEATYLDKHF